MTPAALLIPEPVPITAQQWEELPEDVCKRLEVVDGLAQVSPQPSVMHQRVLSRLATLLNQHGTPVCEALPEIEVRFSDDPLHLRVPDLVVAKSWPEEGNHVRPDQVLLVAEIISPSTVTQDRIHKRGEYAAAGIEHYWLVDILHRSVKLEVFRLTQDEGYWCTGRFENEVARISEPFAIDIDLAQLTSRR